ncbi:uncharacterized protein M437DRAFT_37432 [Aureobasidium melanogenum CBS 110374]|uniref:Uncharacterized protein n=1 Tax=Aureobasidium melanogenum (strain CBS 110374) TaxID=1043003 RepID=A0A074W7F0_AURM1|nr:uncharacterized protein M437DRAFT_37432 [Aureobasidium melanogenum CBS 110374]KEQ67499.1 hypothetical protein M437DRAFT_37432 [Aureobasidium melanogenum CBS 110374]
MAPKSTRHHDTTSGLSWNETIISTASKPLSSQIYDFLHRSVGVPPPLCSMNERGMGVDALESMALRCLLNNLAMLEVQSLEGVPEVWLKRLWEEIQRNNLQSLHLWQIFTKVSPSSPPTPTYRTTTHNHLPLALLSPSISAPPAIYLTSLTLISTIADYNTSIHILPSLPNLVSLHINGSSSSTAQTSMITDDTMRLWNKKARNGTAFPCLRYLVLRFQLGVTELSLRELDGFGALEMMVTSRCGVCVKQGKKIAKDKGWKMTSKAFYAHASTSLETKPSGRNFVDLVDEYITTVLTSSSSSPSPPLSLIQLGRQPPNASTNILFSTSELECWVQDTEKTKTIETERRKRIQEKEEEKQENGKKRRRIKDAKKRNLLELLEGM